jgi:WD40 repeat protein
VFSPDSQFVTLAVAGPDDRAIRVFRWSDGWQPRAMDFAALMPLDVIWAHKTNRLFVPSSENAIRVYDGGNGGHLATLSGHTDWVYSVAVTPDGAKLASGSADGTVKLWNTADNRLLATFIQFTPRTDQWLIVAPPGHLSSSAPTALQWTATNVKTPPEKIAEVLQHPDLVAKAIAGEQIGPATLP